MDVTRLQGFKVHDHYKVTRIYTIFYKNYLRVEVDSGLQNYAKMSQRFQLFSQIIPFHHSALHLLMIHISYPNCNADITPTFVVYAVNLQLYK